MRFDAPRGERSGKSRPPMAGEEEAGRARGLRGKTKPPGGKLGQAHQEAAVALREGGLRRTRDPQVAEAVIRA